MDQQDLFNYYQNCDIRPSQHLNLSKNAALNPWSQNQLINPYLNVKDIKPKIQSNSVSFKNLHTRQKFRSLNQIKSNNHLPIIQLRDSIDSNKVQKQLPKLNICHNNSQHDVIKKKKATHQFAKRFIMNSSPLYFSSPTVNKQNPVHTSPDLGRKGKGFATVSRELDVTRKIYLLQNKLASSVTISPQRKSKWFGREEGDIRRLVEKEWAKKI